MKIDKAAIEAAKEMGRTPNTGEWDLPKNLDNTLAVGRALLQTVDAYKAEQKKARVLRAELKEAKRLLKKASDWLETANGIIQESADSDEGDDEDAKAFIEELREVAA
jgi:hypothetical protein